MHRLLLLASLVLLPVSAQAQDRRICMDRDVGEHALSLLEAEEATTALLADFERRLEASRREALTLRMAEELATTRAREAETRLELALGRVREAEVLQWVWGVVALVAGGALGAVGGYLAGTL